MSSLGQSCPVLTALLLVSGACAGGSPIAEEQPAAPRLTPEPEQAEASPPPLAVGCSADAPGLACRRLEQLVGKQASLIWQDADPQVTMAICPADGAADDERVGLWRYALVAPLYESTTGISTDELRNRWSQSSSARLRMSEETASALAKTDLGPPTRPKKRTPGAAQVPSNNVWEVIPADALTPHGRVVAIDGIHPLGKDAERSPLSVGLCLRGRGGRAAAEAIGADAVVNIDPRRMTVVAMTGVTAMTRRTGILMDKKGPEHIAEHILPWFRDADVVHISNEVSFVPKCKYETSGLTFCSKDSTIRLLEHVGTNVIELTGSHLSDYGRRWLTRTVEMYEQRGWHWFGGGRNQAEASRPLSLEHNGNRLGFVGCNQRISDKRRVKAGPNVAYCDEGRLEWQIRELRRTGQVPIVSVQHKERPEYDPGGELVSDFRRYAETGAAFVFGSQAHVPHPWEMHYRAFIHYGAGNLFFDQAQKNTRSGVFDLLYIHRNRLLTVEQRFTRQERGRPRPMSARERQRFVATLDKTYRKFKRRSKPWRTPAAPEHRSPQRPETVLIGTEPQPMLVFAPQAVREHQDSAGRKWPLVIFLHGSDERGGSVDDVRVRGLPNEVEANPAGFPFFVASPVLPRRKSWTDERVIAVLDFMLARYPIDADRVYLTGLSLGANGAWRTASKHPDRFAALIAVAGYTEPRGACALRDLPVWTFHGDRDWNVPIKESYEMISAIERCGGERARLTVYNGAGHEAAWLRAYKNPDLYTWMLKHQRSPEERARTATRQRDRDAE